MTAGQYVITAGKADYGPARVSGGGMREGGGGRRWPADRARQPDRVRAGRAARVDDAADREREAVAGVDVAGDLEGHAVTAASAQGGGHGAGARWRGGVLDGVVRWVVREHGPGRGVEGDARWSRPTWRRWRRGLR